MCCEAKSSIHVCLHSSVTVQVNLVKRTLGKTLKIRGTKRKVRLLNLHSAQLCAQVYFLRVEFFLRDTKIRCPHDPRRIS